MALHINKGKTHSLRNESEQKGEEKKIVRNNKRCVYTMPFIFIISYPTGRSL